MKNCRVSFAAFFEMLPRFSDLINSNDCIGKITSKSVRLKKLLLKKRFEVNKKQIVSSEKMRNSGNCIYDYAHSFYGMDF